MSTKADEYRTVVVVGAGSSGLYAAQHLKQQCRDVLVVEAQDHVGGRIRQVSNPVTIMSCLLAAVQSRCQAEDICSVLAAAVHCTRCCQPSSGTLTLGR